MRKRAASGKGCFSQRDEVYKADGSAKVNADVDMHGGAMLHAVTDQDGGVLAIIAGTCSGDRNL